MELLERHYSTIGIGDVFTAPISSHALPSSYLRTGKDSTHTTNVEIVGRIKESPGDFIVQEIPDASLIPERDVAHVSDSEMTELLHNPEKLENQPMSPVQPESMQESLLILSLESILESRCVIDPEKSILKDLQTMHSAAESILQQGGVKATEDRPEDRKVMVTLDHDADGAFRGAFHMALRKQFPLFLSNTTSAGVGPDKQYSIHVMIDDRFFSLLSCLSFPHEDCLEMYQYYREGFELSRSSKAPVLRLKTGLGKDERRRLHHIIQQGSNRLLTSSTNDDSSSIQIRWHGSVNRRLSKKRKRKQSGKSGVEGFLCVLQKTNCEHLDMIHKVAAAFRCRPTDVGLAGIKDKRAVTFQFCTLHNIGTRSIRRAREELRKHQINLGEVRSVDFRLDKGRLLGNRFSITLRGLRQVKVTGGRETMATVDGTHVRVAVDRLRKNGFINYFGTQRVGMPGSVGLAGVRSFDIGRALIRQDFDSAIELIMTGRKPMGDNEEADKVSTFRKIWKSSGGDVRMALKALPGGSLLSRESAIMKGLNRYGKSESLKAFRCLPWNERVFYTNAWQSFIWNQVATQRWSEFGAQVCIGDLVMNSDGCVQVVSNVDHWSILDVVLPMPGHNVMYPANKIGDIYQKMFEEHQVDVHNSGKSEPETKIGGSYRKLVARATNLKYTIDEDVMNITFDLQKGCFATMLLRELMVTSVHRVDQKPASKLSTDQ